MSYQPPNQQPDWQQPYQQPSGQYQPQWQQPPMMPPSPKKKNRLWLIIGIVVATLILCGVIGSTFSKGNTSATTTDTNTTTQQAPATIDTTTNQTQLPKWTTVQTFTGSGNKKTSVFAVPDDWKIIWKCNTSDIASQIGNEYNLGVDVYGSDGLPVDLGTVSELCKTGNTSGETEEHQSGNVYLDIQSEAGWTIQIQALQ